MKKAILLFLLRQMSRGDKPGGFVRVFVSSRENPCDTEQAILRQMSKITGDAKWEQIKNVKALTLEHKMAASRLGFKNFYESLHNVPSYRQGLMDSSLSVNTVASR